MKEEYSFRFGIALLLFLLAAPTLAFAHENDTMMPGKQLAEAGVPCSELDEGQLELMGDYYMEQIHSGDAHDIMDQMMGGEGSESLKQMHIAMARRIYCNENAYVGYGMMGSNLRMPMMGSGMMNMMFGGGNMPFGYDMMGSWGTGFYGTLYFLLAFGLVILVYLWIWKVWKDIQKKS